MFNFLIWLGMFSAFINPMGLLSYLVIFRLRNIKLSYIDCLFFLYLFFIFVYNIMSGVELFNLLYTFRFYFGFVIFYLYFKSDNNFDFSKVFIIFLFFIPIEALLINTIISPKVMPNFPSEEAFSHFSLTGYQRPYSFAGNASISSCIVIAIAAFLFPKNRKYNALLIFITAVFSSGTGWLAYFLFRVWNRIKILFFIFSIFSILSVLYYNELINLMGMLSSKISAEYITLILEYKLLQFSSLLNDFTYFDMIAGNLVKLNYNYGGDFGWLYFSLVFGFLSFIIMSIYIFSKINRHTIIPVTILFVFTFHYPVIFFIPGQIFLGFLLSQHGVREKCDEF